MPLLRHDVSTTDWAIFAVTKGIHNALQGSELPLTTALAEEYLDPQPAALPHRRRRVRAPRPPRQSFPGVRLRRLR